MIILIAIGFVFLFLLVSYFFYSVLDFQYTSGKQNLETDDYLTAIMNMGEFEFSLPFNVETVKSILYLQLSAWYIYMIAIAFLFLIIISQDRNDFKNMEHGSARWMNNDEIKVLQKEAEKSTQKLPLAYNTYISLNSKFIANLNEIVIGGSGAGKSFRKIKPDILQMNGSYVVTDPKGELYRDCAKVLKKNGYKVRVLNLVNLNYSNSYNPFVYVTSEQDVVDLAALFMKNTAGDGEKEDFFTGAASKLLTALMMYLYKSDNEIKTFGRIIRLLNSIRYKKGSIDMSCELARCLNKHATLYPYDIASTNWGGMQGNAQETQSSINEVLSTRLSLFGTTDLDAITSTDEMDFDSVGKEKTAIFLIIPSARNTYKVVCNIFYSQLFERLRRVADADYNGKLPLIVSCELDEFANIGEIPAFNETLAVVRSYNIRICIVLQGLSQLKALYEKTYESIIGNCDIFTMLGSKDNDTLQYVSDKIGKITVRNDSHSYGRPGVINSMGGQDTVATGERPLLYPDEIKEAIKPKGINRKYGGNTIVFLGYEKPLYAMKFDTVNHPLFAECGSAYSDYVHNNTYVEKEYAPIWQDRLVAYKQMYSDYEYREEQNRSEYNQAERELKEKEQRELENAFEAAITPPPVNADQSEEEYVEYQLNADKPDYDIVPDFSENEEEDIYDDVAPICSEDYFFN